MRKDHTNFEIYVTQAVQLLKPDYTEFSFSTTEIVDWMDNDNPPTKEELDAKIAELKVEYDSLEYARDRSMSYPAIGDQLDALYHAGVFPEDMTAKLKKVKDDNPKG